MLLPISYHYPDASRTWPMDASCNSANCQLLLRSTVSWSAYPALNILTIGIWAHPATIWTDEPPTTCLMGALNEGRSFSSNRKTSNDGGEIIQGCSLDIKRRQFILSYESRSFE
jgi:hypothetical protein